MHELSPNQLMKMQIGFDGKLAILILLARLPYPVSARGVARVFGISEHRAGRHLQQMLDLQWVHQVSARQGYVVNRDVLLDILAIETAAALLASAEPPAAELPEGDALQHNAEPSRPVDVRIVQQDATTTAFKPENQNRKKDSAVVAAESVAALRPAGSTGPPAGHKSPRAPANHQRLLSALADEGIGEPKRSQLAAMHHLDAEQVARWAAFLKAERGDRFTTGLLIHVLASGDPAPVPRHPHDCRCVECLLGPYLCQECRCEPCVCDEYCPDCDQLECTCDLDPADRDLPRQNGFAPRWPA